MTAYVLGAGFSKAISPRWMPVMGELSRAVVAELESLGQPEIPAADTPLASNFERWLSYLGGGAPWVSDSWIRHNEGAFLAVAKAVHTVMKRAEQASLMETRPAWLDKLVAYWEQTDAVVCTFNYDHLVEATWMLSPVRYTPSGPLSLYPVPISPASLRTGGTLGALVRDRGMTLLKLHGSLGWYYSGLNSPPGDPIYDIGPDGAWGQSSIHVSSERFQQVIDKQPMIVPPAALKSGYYSNSILKSLWGQAANELVAADEIVIIGFSFPPSDQLVGAMLATATRPGTRFVPVNRDPQAPDRLSDLLRYPDRTDLHGEIEPKYCGGDDAIERWVTDHTADSSYQ